MLVEKYGGEENFQTAPSGRAAVLENEQYVEYDEAGGIKGAPKPQSKSKYAEDVLINNHTAVWGSWWKDFTWGYACCHSTVKNSYCTGEAGKIALAEANRVRTGADLGVPETEKALERTVTTREPALAVDEDMGREGPKEAAAKKKRTLNEMRGGVTEEELEAYKRSKAVADDPMAKFLGKDELVH